MVKTKKRYSKISTYGQAALGTFFMALAVRWIYEPQSMVDMYPESWTHIYELG